MTYCLWFADQAREAVDFYGEVFGQRTTPSINSMGDGQIVSASFDILGAPFVALNGNRRPAFNPSLSFFVSFPTAAELDAVYGRLSPGGRVLMPLDSYDWSARYVWLNDRYGVSWQLMLEEPFEPGPRVSPLLFFSGKNRGGAAKALDHYLAIFQESKKVGALFYTAEEGLPESYVKHAMMQIGDRNLMLMDSATDDAFPFNDSVSIMLHCDGQEAVDYYWDRLLAEGGTENMCGWLRDRFGVAWQVIPEGLQELLSDPDPGKSMRVVQAMMKMRKLDINHLREL